MKLGLLLLLAGCGGIGTVEVAPAPETDAGASSFVEAGDEVVHLYGGEPANPPQLGGYSGHTPKPR